MSDFSNDHFDATGVRPRLASDSHVDFERAQETTSTLSPLDSQSLMREASIGTRVNSPVRASSLLTMQQTHGNRAVQRVIQRSSSAQQAVPVQRWGVDGIWDSIKGGGSAAWDAMQKNMAPNPGKALVGPVVNADNLPMMPVGPVVNADNLAIPGMASAEPGTSPGPPGPGWEPIPGTKDTWGTMSPTTQFKTGPVHNLPPFENGPTGMNGGT